MVRERDDGEAPRANRRAFLKSVGIGLALAAASAVGIASLVERRLAVRDRRRAGGLAQDAYAALRAGDLARALALATEARDLDPDDADARSAWLHATGMSLLEAEPDASKAIGYVAEVRKMNLRNPDLAFCQMAAAVAIKNDRFARRLIDQHKEQNVGGDAFYEFAAGAAYDLDCDPAGASNAFATSASRWQDAPLARVRHARSLLFEERFEEASNVVATIAPGEARVVLEDTLARLTGDAAAPARIDASAIDALPRSIRPLARALVGSAEPATIVAAVTNDTDTPLVAALWSRIALHAGDLDVAERTSEAALASRPELGVAATLLVRARLLRGSLERAAEVAESTGDAELLSLVQAIRAYEQRDAEALVRVRDDARAAGLEGWSLVPAALGLLGQGPPPAEAALTKGVESRAPWADVLLVDAAIASSDLARAEKLLERWPPTSEALRRRRNAIAERRSTAP
jgi:tetratricopeptide (TPR) repeat protein